MVSNDRIRIVLCSDSMSAVRNLFLHGLSADKLRAIEPAADSRIVGSSLATTVALPGSTYNVSE